MACSIKIDPTPEMVGAAVEIMDRWMGLADYEDMAEAIFAAMLAVRNGDVRALCEARDRIEQHVMDYADFLESGCDDYEVWEASRAQRKASVNR